MNIEWLKNKTKEKFYPITHAKAVLFGENNRTVNDEIELLKNDLSNIKDGTTPVAKAVADEDGNNIKSTYAKKTEVPSGSKELNYSTDEQVVGTWIDGKPIYQKTISAEILFSQNGQQIADISNLNIKDSISYKCTIYDSLNNESYALPMHGSVNLYNMNILFKNNGLTLSCEQASAYSRILKIYITLQYTKTTD